MMVESTGKIFVALNLLVATTAINFRLILSHMDNIKKKRKSVQGSNLVQCRCTKKMNFKS